MGKQEVEVVANLMREVVLIIEALLTMKERHLSVAEALGLMISFGSLISTIIFGILIAAKKDNKK